MMRNLMLFILTLFGAIGVACQDVTVGFLVTESASYDPDTMIVRRVLNLEDREIVNPEWEQMLDWGYTEEDLIEMEIPHKIVVHGEDYDRNRLDLPWASTTIQGVDGTQPMYVSIKEVNTDTGDVDAMMNVLSVRGDGTFLLPTHVESIPTGRYRISLTFANEGYSKDVNDCFTIIVK